MVHASVLTRECQIRLAPNDDHSAQVVAVPYCIPAGLLQADHLADHQESHHQADHPDRKQAHLEGEKEGTHSACHQAEGIGHLVVDSEEVDHWAGKEETPCLCLHRREEDLDLGSCQRAEEACLAFLIVVSMGWSAVP
jgi:hypothetical protein